MMAVIARATVLMPGDVPALMSAMAAGDARAAADPAGAEARRARPLQAGQGGVNVPVLRQESAPIPRG